MSKYPKIIKCPNCNSLFKLNQKPTQTFSCPKCKHKAPFDEIMKQEYDRETQVDTPQVKGNSNLAGESTKVVNFGEKTVIVAGLQPNPSKTAILNISYKGVNIGKVTLPKSGNFNLGRRSSDSTAHIKIAPDMTMSRVHAAMRVVITNEGKSQYQITTIKPENPVYVNGVTIGKGKICILKSGDKIQLGETELTFKLD